jgi:8-oxo-dGTP diphosphatase
MTKGCDSDAEGYPPFAVTVDVVILSVVDRRLEVLLVQRGGDPFQGMWAIPGGFKHPDETLDEAAARELLEETGVEAPRHLAQFGTYGDPGRDPRGNVVTVGYLAVTPEIGSLTAGTDAAEARLWPVADVLAGEPELAFDHHRILTDAVERARADLEDSDLATAFVGPTFTLGELQSVYEAIWGEPLDAANFRRSMAVDADFSYVRPTGERAESGPKGGRRPELFRPSDAWSQGSPVKRGRRRSATRKEGD